MTDDSIMPFGKYKGEKMANVPADYLLWLYNNHKCYGSVQYYIQENKDTLELEIKLKQQKGGKNEELLLSRSYRSKR